VVVGLAGTTTGNEITVARYNSDGILDTAFATGGLATANLGGGIGVGEAVLIQPDDKILVAATALVGHLGNGATALVRFNSDGSEDSTFGVSGAELVTGATGGADALAVLEDGDILVVNHGGIAQFTPTGSLESTVTGGPIAASSPGGIFLADGDFIDPATVATGKHISDAQVFEFTATGNVDRAFNNPLFAFLPGGMNSAESTGFQSDGKIVVGGGHCAPGFSSCLFGMARLDTSGSLDSSFGTNGMLTTEFSGEDLGYEIVLIQPDDKIIAVGSSIDHAKGQANVALARYLPQ